jgi:hypothetical protein
MPIRTGAVATSAMCVAESMWLELLISLQQVTYNDQRDTRNGVDS